MQVIVLLILLLFVSAIPLTLGLCLNKRYKKLKFTFFAIAGLLLVTQSGVWLYDFSGMQATNHYLQLRGFLNKPSALKELISLRSKTIVALSYMSEGLVSYAIQHRDKQTEIINLLDKNIQIAFNPDISPYKNINNVSDWGEEGLYLSHLNVILGSYQRLAGDRKYFALNETISQHLAKKVLAEPFNNIRSYNEGGDRWPADNTVTLYSLYLFDKNNNTNIGQMPIQKWLNYMETKGSEPTTNLHYSELTGIQKYSKYPRGCALSWTAKYMSDFAPKEAREFWNNYKKQYKKNFLIVSGFREYPPNANLSPDGNSGPIVFGMGAGATGLALNGAKYVGDYLTYYQINNTFRFVDFVANILSFFGKKKLENLSQDVLATSLRFNAETKVPWYDSNE